MPSQIPAQFRSETPKRPPAAKAPAYRASPRREPPPSGCPLEECLRFLSGAWTHKIIWFLQGGPRRFGDLRRDLGTISSKVLTDRLREMEKQGVVTRTVLPTSPVTVEYALTDLGREFHPVFEAMVRVARKLRKDY